jgi:hypothetical protein
MLINISAKAVRHAKCLTFQPVEVAVPRRLFAAILKRIQQLRKDAAGLALSGRFDEPFKLGPVVMA